MKQCVVVQQGDGCRVLINPDEVSLKGLKCLRNPDLTAVRGLPPEYWQIKGGKVVSDYAAKLPPFEHQDIVYLRRTCAHQRVELIGMRRGLRHLAIACSIGLAVLTGIIAIILAT